MDIKINHSQNKNHYRFFLGHPIVIRLITVLKGPLVIVFPIVGHIDLGIELTLSRVAHFLRHIPTRRGTVLSVIEVPPRVIEMWWFGVIIRCDRCVNGFRISVPGRIIWPVPSIGGFRQIIPWNVLAPRGSIIGVIRLVYHRWGIIFRLVEIYELVLVLVVWRRCVIDGLGYRRFLLSFLMIRWQRRVGVLGIERPFTVRQIEWDSFLAFRFLRLFTFTLFLWKEPRQTNMLRC